MPLEDGDAAPSLTAPTASVGVCACCFVCQVTRGPHTGERVTFDAAETPHATLGVGRKSVCWLRLRKDLEISGLHAELTVTYKQKNNINANAIVSLMLSDANSTNGTRVNGELLARSESHAVHDQDLLQFGRTTVRVRMGNTECVRARQDEKEALVITNEPEDEPAALALALASQADEQANKDEPTPRVGTSDHSDEHAFEESVRPTSNPTPTPTPTAKPLVSSSSLLDVCMVCGQMLAAWSMLEQQLHVNACLDKHTNTAPTTSRLPTVPTVPTISTAANANTNSKKRKRQAKVLQDEQLAVALALSASLVEKEQQVDMEIALVNGELTQVDAQLKKLQKKRVALVKKLEKLAKNKKKVHKSQVVGPEETRVRLDVDMALRVLFPRAREVQARGEENGKRTRRTRWRWRPAVVRLVERYRAVEEEEMGDAYVTMWMRCAQLGGGHDRGGGADKDKDKGKDMEDEDEQQYVNRLLRRLRARHDEPVRLFTENAVEVEEAEEAEGPEEVKEVEEAEEADKQTQAEEKPSEEIEANPASSCVVPDVVKRVFPQWQANLAFLTTQSQSDLRDALSQMRKMIADRHQRLEKEEGGDDGDETPSGHGQGKDDEVVACAFFEREMLRLLAEREREEREVVVLVDSQDDEEHSVPMPRDEDGQPLPREAELPSIWSIDDSSQEEEEAVIENDSVQTAEHERTPMEGVMEDGVEVETIESREDSTPRTQVQDAVEESSDSRLERQLLTALKANAALYERVLLLQPLDLHELLRYMRDNAGLTCPKTALMRFCDRHGITFKSS